MLSDKGSVVIRKFDILNPNVPQDLRFYGMPFPGQYLVGPDGVVRQKIFMPDYQERPTASEILLVDFGTSAGGSPIAVAAGDVQAVITLSEGKSYSGQRLGVAVDFKVAPGWHIYGQPLPDGEGLTPTSVKFDDELVSQEQVNLPQPTPLLFKALNETLPVYTGDFRAVGSLTLKQKLKPGDYKIAGTLEFQECNDAICKMPQTVKFELPLKIEPLANAVP